MAHILLVEDDPWMATCYYDWLAPAGHTVHVSRDPQGAIDYIDTTPPHLIILDLLLPYANGVQLLHTLQSYGDLAGIPVILCSSSLPDNLPDLEAYGVKRIVAKAALTPVRLRTEVQEVLAGAAI